MPCKHCGLRKWDTYKKRHRHEYVCQYNPLVCDLCQYWLFTINIHRICLAARVDAPYSLWTTSGKRRVKSIKRESMVFDIASLTGDQEGSTEILNFKQNLKLPYFVLLSCVGRLARPT